MILRVHYSFDLAIGAFAVLLIGIFWYAARSIRNDRYRLWIRCGLSVAALVVILGVATSPVRVSSRMPPGTAQWAKGAALLICAWVLYAAPVLAVLKWTTKQMPQRRRFFRAAAGAALTLPPVVAATAFVRRNDLQFREFDVAIPGLPPDLHGLRIVQISDIHLSAFVNESLLARAVAMANEAKGHIAVVTGDLISVSGDPLDTCLQRLRALRSDAGIYGCLGNHEIYTGAEAYTAEQGAKLGIKFLRSRSETLTFGNAKLNLGGVDYQRRQKPYLVGAEKLIRPGETNVLLSHNPDVFPVAAAQGFDLTLSGHTHGGQVNFEILEHDVNIARFFTPYVYGRYERGGKSLFVTRGIGTVGAPARLGAPPEVALIRLCVS